MAKVLNKYWGRFFGGLASLYYVFFFFILCCLITSDVFYFGKITMPETPGHIFIVFFLVPAVYAVKLGVEVFARLIEFLVPILATIFVILLLLALPKLDLLRIFPVMAEGIKPVIGGAIPNMNFPYAQILPVVFYYKNTKSNAKGYAKVLKYTFGGIFMATILLMLRSLAAITAFDEATLKTLTFPPFSTIRIIELGDIIERLDPLLLAVFYCTTYFKFILTYFVICEIISDTFEGGKPKDYAWPIAVLIGVSMPFLIPRFDTILKTVVPYFIVSLPLLILIPLILFITIKWKRKKRKAA